MTTAACWTARRINVALGLGALVLLLSPLAFSVGKAGEGIWLLGVFQVPELCLSKRLTGLACPSCGIGRSIVRLVHGDLAGSLAFHPGGVVLWSWVAAVAAWRLAAAWRVAGWGHWRLDLGVTLGSLLFACLAAARLVW